MHAHPLRVSGIFRFFSIFFFFVYYHYFAKHISLEIYNVRFLLIKHAGYEPFAMSQWALIYFSKIPLIYLFFVPFQTCLGPVKPRWSAESDKHSFLARDWKQWA